MKDVILVINGGSGDATPFNPGDYRVISCNSADELIKCLDNFGEHISFCVQTGGADVCASLYGDVSHPTTHGSERRDALESLAWVKVTSMGIPSIGICRGAQLLCVLNGGHLVQDIDGHVGSGGHRLFIHETGEMSPADVTSCHHQLQYPFSLPDDRYEVLADSGRCGISREFRFGTGTVIVSHSDNSIYPIISIRGEIPFLNKEKLLALSREPDVVLYRTEGGIPNLGIQYHPEWMISGSWGFNYAREMARRHILSYVERN